MKVVDAAFRDADTVFWLVPPDPHASSPQKAYVDFSRPACNAMKTSGIKRVVSVSALGKGHPMAMSAGLVTASLAMDDLIAGTGAAFRALTMPSFMDNLLRQLPSIRDHGAFSSPIAGDLKLPSCATMDIALAAAELLLDPSWAGFGHRAVLGPQDISFDDMAGTMSSVLGWPVRYERISFEAYEARFITFGMCPAMARGMTDMARAKDAGLDRAENRTPQNTTPTSFAEWCETTLKPAITVSR